MKTARIATTSILSASAFALALLAQSASAIPFTITSTLTGDTRPENPDNLFVNVSISGNTDSNQAVWTIDIASPLHPDIKLDEFYFNMAGSVSQYTFSGFDPIGWAINSTGVTVQGAGGVTFMFEALDPNEPPGEPNFNAADVTNAQNLTFTMLYTGGNLSPALFTTALIALSNDAGSGQLGAHLQSLVQATGNNTDSGFAFGRYVYDGSSGQTDLPEPGVLLLLGAGLMGMGLARRRKSA